MIVELSTEEEWASAHQVLIHLRANLSQARLLKNRCALIKKDYHLLGYVESDEILGVAGYIIQPHIDRA